MTGTAILYCSACRKPESMIAPMRARVLDQARRLHMMTVAVTCEPVAGFGVRLRQEKGQMPVAMFEAWRMGLQEIPDGWTVYNVDDDCLYPDEHFRMHLPGTLYGVPVDPTGTYNYDLNVIYLNPAGFFEMYNRGSISNGQAWARKEVMADCVERKLVEARDFMAGRLKAYCYEPAGSLGYPTNHTRAKIASIDVRGAHNSTWRMPAGARVYQNETGWPAAAELVKEYSIQ